MPFIFCISFKVVWDQSLNVELFNDGRQAAAEFDLNELINSIDKNRPLRLSLSGVFSELPVPPFVVKEWRSLT